MPPGLTFSPEFAVHLSQARGPIRRIAPLPRPLRICLRFPVLIGVVFHISNPRSWQLICGWELVQRYSLPDPAAYSDSFNQFRITASLLSSTSWSHLSKMLRPVSVEEHSMAAASSSMHERRVRLLNQLSVRLMGLMANDDFFKHGVGIRKDDCVQFFETVQDSGVCIDFKTKPHSVDLLLEYCKKYQLIPADDEADEWVSYWTL